MLAWSMANHHLASMNLPQRALFVTLVRNPGMTRDICMWKRDSQHLNKTCENSHSIHEDGRRIWPNPSEEWSLVQMGEAAGYLKQLRLEARPILTLMILMTLISQSSVRDVCSSVHVVLIDLTMKTLRILMTLVSLCHKCKMFCCTFQAVLYSVTSPWRPWGFS